MSLLPVEAVVGQDRCAGLAGGTDETVLGSVQSAHLEQVGEIAVEEDAQAQVDRTIAVVADRKPLIGSMAPEKNRAHDVNGVLRQDKALVEINIRIGQIDSELGVVVAYVRAEQQGLHAVEKKLEVGEISRVAMKQPVGPAGRGAVVAVAVDDDETIAVFEGAPRPCGRAGRWNVESRLGNNVQRQFRERDALDRHATPVSSFLFPARAAASRPRLRAPGATPS